MGEAFVERNLGRLNMVVRLLSGVESCMSFGGQAEPAGENADNGRSQPMSEPVSIIVEESTVPDEGRNPYIALGWFSLTADPPSLRRRLGAGGAGNEVAGGGGAAETAPPSKVVVCLGGGPTCNFEFERACSEGVDSLWYCLYLPPRLDASGGGQTQSQLQSSVNALHAEEAGEVVTTQEWRFGGKIYQTNAIKRKCEFENVKIVD